MFSGHSSHGDPQNSTQLYDLLELDKSASQADIKKAYRRLAVLHHPDKGGDAEHFKELSHAYEVLSDEEKRALYNVRGEKGIQGGVADPADIFEMFFGGGCGSRGRGRKKTKDIVHPLSISLEQIYTGCTKKLAIHRDVVDGGGDAQSCGECGGTGLRAEMLHVGPVLRQGQTPCKACTGLGKKYSIKKVREVLEVFIEKGVPHGHKIVFSGKADEHPGCDPGDVVLIVHQQDHPEFRRRGADLFLAREIGLLDALTGFRMPITHLDGRKLVAATRPGEVVQPLAEGTGLKALRGEGMPTQRSPFVFGALFLILTVRFPDTLDPAGGGPAALPKLKRVLPGPADDEVIEDDAEVCAVEDMDPVESSARDDAACPWGEAYEAEDAGQGAGGFPLGGCRHQ